MDRVWGDAMVESNAIEVHIGRLRDKPRYTVLRKLSTWIFAGSLAELLATVPSHVIVSRRPGIPSSSSEVRSGELGVKYGPSVWAGVTSSSAVPGSWTPIAPVAAA